MKRFFYVDFIKTIASLLILNFHFEMFFPDKLSILSIGGDIGNNLFFMISGYILYTKICNMSSNDFTIYYKSRIRRILPLFVFFEIISFILNNEQINNFWSFFQDYVFPSMFWFITAILLFYFLIYIQIQRIDEKYNIYILICLVLMHLIFDGIYVECYVIGYISMIIGYYSHKYENHFIKHINIKLVIFVVSYVVLKMLRKLVFVDSRLVHLLIGISIVFICYYAIALCCKNNDILESFFSKNKYIHALIEMISNSTLEIYLVNVFGDLYIIRQFNSLFKFPFSYLACLVFIIFVSCVINKLVRRMNTK